MFNDIDMLKTIQKFREYLDYLEKHYKNVQRAWVTINESCDNNKFRFMHDDFVWHSIDHLIKTHDYSKLSAEEFTQYRKMCYPTDDETINDDIKQTFDKAWQHHYQNNSHHWQNWTKRTDIENDPYADIYVITMLADWIAMSMVDGNANAKQYYDENKHKMNLPEWADKLVNDVLIAVYY